MTVGQANEQFEQWLEEMHPRLARFEDFLMPQSWTRGFRRESLAELEAHMLERWPDRAAFAEQPDPDFVDGAVRYIGETLLRLGGGSWFVDDDASSILGGRPYIRLDTLDRTAISPFNLMTTLLARRTGQVLTKVFDAQSARVGERREQEGPGWEPHRAPVAGLTSEATESASQSPERAEWVSQVPGWVEELRSRLGADGGRLDLSPGSVDVLEGWLLAEVPAGSAPSDVLRDASAAYLGEVARSNAGGDWVFRSGDPDENPYAGRPCVRREDEDGKPRNWPPHVSVDAVLRDRAPGVLARHLASYSA